MALTAAGSGHTRYAMLAAIICAGTVLYGITLITTTVRRDHRDHHNTPNLLQDSWQLSPAFARRRGAPRAVEPRRDG